MRPVLVVVGLTVAAALSGCSSAGSPAAQSSPSATQVPISQVRTIHCPDSLRDAFSPRGEATFTYEVIPGVTTCSFQTRSPRPAACTAASVMINTNPQPFKDFQRWVVETTQDAGTASLGKDLTPQPIDGIGTEADWLPGSHTFETATDSRWIAIQLTCPSADASSLTLAESLARAALAAR